LRTPPTALLGLLLATVALSPFDRSFAQSPECPDPATYVDLQLKTLSTVKTSELQHSRNYIAHQIMVLPVDRQTAITTNLLSRLDGSDGSAKFNAAAILAVYPTPWATANTAADAEALYSKLLTDSDVSLKNILDSALANAKGLYRDGIRDYILPKLDTQKSAESKLRAMSTNYPGRVKTLRGITASGILRLVVTLRAKICKNSSSA
jgi:hypothetical protein